MANSGRTDLNVTLSRRLAVAGTLAVAGALALPAWGQADYPNRPVRIVVPFVAGGGPDLTARIIAEALTGELGQPFIVENMAGGGTVIGTAAAAAAEPDGYTLLLGSNSLALAPSLRSDLPFDAVADLRGVSMVVRQPFALAVYPGFAAQSLEELLEMARAEPGSILYASSGAGTGNHLVTEQFQMMAGIELTHVPYQGTGAALVDLIAGRVDMIITTAAPLYQYFEAGTLRPLAVGDLEELPPLPGVPPIATAVEGFDETSWNGIFAPNGTPPEIIARLNQAIGNAMERAEVREAFERTGAVPYVNSPAEFDAFLANEITKWRVVIEATGLEVE